MISFNDLHKRLEKYGQSHLLKYWDELNEEQQKKLSNDIIQLNFDELQSIYERATNKSSEDSKLDDRLQPLVDQQLLSINRATKDEIIFYEKEGLRQIAHGRVGVLLMAGGQGTRLGSKNPKGMFCVGLHSGKSLFRIQAERILALQRLATKFTGGQVAKITWYIMTSGHTMEPTRAYFEANNYFGLDKTNIYMFEQGSLPCYGFDSKILLDEKHQVAMSPDGNGGIYRAIRDQEVLNDMMQRGIMYLHAHSVDNILIKVADPVFIGYCVKQNAECAAKVVEKSLPNEAVGIICIVDGLYQVVEYSEIPTKTSELRNSDGRLTFNAANICNHFFTVDFLNKIGSTFESKLKLHVAKKKIPFIDNSGVRIIPDKPNGIKIEKFVFDVFEFAEKFVVVVVARDEEFSPIKNADISGTECASTARMAIHKLHKKFIENAGGVVHGDECEISPLVSYFGEGLEGIVNDKTFTSPVYLKSSLDHNESNEDS